MARLCRQSGSKSRFEGSEAANWAIDQVTAALGCREDKIMSFDYGSPAELFTAKRKASPRQRLGYRRFATAAEAIRFAVEDFPAMRTLGAWMQVGDERFDSDEIHNLYDSDDYPLQRRTG